MRKYLKRLILFTMVLSLLIQATQIPAMASTVGGESGQYLPYEGAKYQLTYSVNEDEITIVGITGYENRLDLGQLVIPDKINGMKVTKIEEYAFQDCVGFTGELNIPDSVTIIEPCAFQNCSGFTGKLEIPSGVTTIGSCAFEGCNGFTGELNIPEGVTKIGSYAFKDCSGFTGKLSIPKSVIVVGQHAFEGCNITNPDFEFAGGDGTEENPYQVTTAEQLNAIRYNVEASYIQINDIDMSSWKNWKPIVDFTGIYDGGNHCVSNLSIEENEDTLLYAIGLFANSNNTIRNVNLSNLFIDIKGVSDISVGGIVGDGSDARLVNCSVSGKISISDCNNITIGGIAGYAHAEKCTNEAIIYVHQGNFDATCGGNNRGRQLF